MKLPTDLTFRQYMDWKGYQDDEELHKAEKTFSKNKYCALTTFCTVVFNSYKNINVLLTSNSVCVIVLKV